MRWNYAFAWREPLIDMILLLQQGKLDERRVTTAVKATFTRRGTHIIPRKLEEPPAEWKPIFEALAAECGLDMSLPAGFVMVKDWFSGIAERD